MSSAVEERRLWQRQSREFLVVGITAAPHGPDVAAVTLALARSLLGIERRRPNRQVLLFELDFWAPCLAGYLEAERGKTVEAPRSRRDLLSAYDGVIDRPDLHEELRQQEGFLSSQQEVDRWRAALRDLLPEPRTVEEGLLAFPALGGEEGLTRVIEATPHHFLSFPAEPVALPGSTVVRLLLAVTATVHEAGVVLLALPTGWNALTLLSLGRLCDVVILLDRGRADEAPYLRGLWQFLAERRHRETTRPVYEEEVLLRFAGGGAEEGAYTVPEILRDVPDSTGALPEKDAMNLGQQLDTLAASKFFGGIAPQVVTMAEGADRALLEELARWPSEARELKILVEAGPYGEYPIKRLSHNTREALARLGGGGEGFVLTPHPIYHADLLAGLKDTEDLMKGLREQEVELLTFPHYMLGILAEQGHLLPWHVLEDELAAAGATELLTEEQIERFFYQVPEMCRYNGVLYGLPYSLLQKLLLVKRGAESRVSLQWQLLDRQIREGGDWPLVLETQLDHVGIWYDWLEFVHAFGGGDFRPVTRDGSSAKEASAYRGSDYGECWINHPKTLEATVFYLDLLTRTYHRIAQPVDWDRILGLFLDSEATRFTIAWSDIVGYHWRPLPPEETEALPPKERPVGLEPRVRIHPFPLGSGREGRTSVEGWVLAAPSWLAGGRRRLVARVLAWFLSPVVQRRYAECGGNTARRDVGHALGEVQRLVHRTVVFPLRPPALKASFREAPAVIGLVGKALQGWVGPLLESGSPPEREVLEDGLDRLAHRICEEVLRNKARYRSLAFWRETERQRKEGEP